MSQLLDTYSDFSQLSLAAYATLSPDLDNQAALQGAGFSQEQASQFVDRYKVLSQFVPTNLPQNIAGFSATLFEEIDPATGLGNGKKILAVRGTEITVADLAADALIAFGTGEFNPQYQVLKDYYEQLITPTDQQTSSGDQGLGLLAANEQIVTTGHSLGGFLAASFAGDTSLHTGDDVLGFNSGVAHAYTYNAPGTGGILAQLLQLVGVLPSNISNTQVTNINAENGLSLIAGLGVQQGTVEQVFIEAGSALHNHSVITLTDSLAEYDLFGRIAANVTIPTITHILNAASAIPNESLENTLTALQRLFLNQNVAIPTDDRNALFLEITALETRTVDGQPNSPLLFDGTKTVIDLTGISSIELQNLAEIDIAYRYAVTQLNPFVVTGPGLDYTDTTTLNQDGALVLFDSASGTGTLTHEYLTDRAEFLAKKIEVNVADGGLLVGLTNFFNDTHFKDFRSKGFQAQDEIQAGLFTQIVSTPREFLFGDEQSNVLTGQSNDDHLYGGAGHDVLTGQGGVDYLEGNIGNDILIGGTENDTLQGGKGFDLYISMTGDGNDRIEDADGQGGILVNHHLVQGGIHRADDPANTYISLDGHTTFRLSGDLFVTLDDGSQLTVNQNFSSGQLGIRIVDAPDIVTTYDNGLGARTPQRLIADPSGPDALGFTHHIVEAVPFDETANTYDYSQDTVDHVDTVQYVDPDGTAHFTETFVPYNGDGNLTVHALGGNDVIAAGLGNDQLFGDGGNDTLDGGAGNDLLRGARFVFGQAMPSPLEGEDEGEGAVGRTACLLQVAA